MRTSQTLSLEASEKRSDLAAVTERLNAAACAATDPSQEDIAKADTITREVRSIEVRYRASVLEEEEADRVAGLGGGDPELRELRALETRARLSDYMSAAADRRAVEGAARELNEHMNIPLHKFPLRLLAPSPEELERRTETNTDTAVVARNWLDRLFAESAAQRVGITFDAVPAGQQAYPVTTAGAAPVQRGRSQDIADAAWTIGVTTMEPSRHGARAVFNVGGRGPRTDARGSLDAGSSDGARGIHGQSHVCGRCKLRRRRNRRHHRVADRGQRCRDHGDSGAEGHHGRGARAVR